MLCNIWSEIFAIRDLLIEHNLVTREEYDRKCLSHLSRIEKWEAKRDAEINKKPKEGES
jgi:hypothetical protein